MFETLLSIFSSWQASKNIKRYITGCKLIFGKKYSITYNAVKFTAGTPADGKLKVYNSFMELGAGRNVNGKKEFIDVKKYSSLGNIILEPSTIKILMEYKGNPVDYTAQYNRFFASLMWNGQRKYFEYNPSQMWLDVSYTADVAMYKKIQEAAAYEKKCKEFVDKAQRNASLLARLAKNATGMTRQQQEQLSLAVTKHLQGVNMFERNLPIGFILDKRMLKATNVPGIGFAFAIPVIVWVVGIVSTAIVIVSVKYFDKCAEVEKEKQRMDDNYRAIQDIAKAAQQLNNGEITQGQYNDRVDADNKVIDVNTQLIKTAGEADAADKQSGGFLGKMQNILLLGIAAAVVVKIIPSENKN